jgi:four helix bundle protein
MGNAKSFKDLFVWQKAHELVIGVYKMTRLFPAEERFGLVSQMRRVAVSIPANIAEGFVKKSTKDKCNFYNVAQGLLRS